MLPISVIITDHNPERKHLLLEAIDSVFRGDELPSEILVVIDLPEKEGYSYIQELKKEVKSNLVAFLINQNKRGPSGSRNFSLKKASYHWIAFLDSDDLWYPEKLTLQWQYLQKRPFLKACHTRELWIKNGKVIPTPKSLEPGTGKFLIQAFGRCLISMSSVLIQKDVILSLGGFDEFLQAAEDFDFWLRFLIFYPIGLVLNYEQTPLTIKRSGNWVQTSQTKNIDIYRIYSLLKIYKYFLNHLSSLEKESLFEEIHYRYKIIQQQKEKYYSDFDENIKIIYNYIINNDLFYKFNI